LSTFRESALQDAGEKDAEIAQLRADLATVSTALKSEHATELAAVKEAATAARETLMAEHRAAAADAAEAAQLHTTKLERQIAELTESDSSRAARIHHLEAELQDTHAKFAAAKDFSKSSESELASTRTDNAALKAAQHEMQCQINENNVRIAELTQQLKGKNELEQQQAQIMEAADNRREQAENAVKKLETKLVTAEQKSAGLSTEIQKGNKIISQLQSSIAALHSKLEARSSVIVRQEQAISEHEKMAMRSERERAAAVECSTSANAQITTLENEMKATRSELEETKRQLKNSEGIITWLNRQLNDAKRSETAELTKGILENAAVRKPFGSKSANDFNKRQVKYTRSKKETVSTDAQSFDKYLTSGTDEPVKSLIPKAKTATLPTLEKAR